MSPTIASAVFAIGIGALFLLDRNGRAKTSIGLWIPVIWVLIAGSRSVAEWMSTLGGTGITDITSNADAYLEGNPTDRLALTVLLAAGLIVLVARRRQVGELLLANAPIAIFFLYCALSTLWSDYSDVSFKRWVKALGDLVMVLIVLTDPDRVTAVKRLLARTVFLLVPTSVLLIKYYPDLGRGYHPWTWTPHYTGVTLNKNELGYVCLIFGLGSVWRCLQALGGKGSKIWIEFPARAVAIPRSLIAHLAVLAMVMWLFWMANSMTSFSCFLMASVIMATTTLRAAVRKPWLVHVLVAAMLAVSFSALFLDLGSGLVQTMGRDPTLTGRTEIWSLVLGMVRSPLLGTGFESFWLG